MNRAYQIHLDQIIAHKNKYEQEETTALHFSTLQAFSPNLLCETCFSPETTTANLKIFGIITNVLP